MAEYKQYITQIQENGNVMISEDVVATIVAYALAEVEGVGSLGVKPGIVVKPKTPASAVAEYLPIVDLVLVMTVEPGFGGQKFMADMMPKVKELRAMLDEVNPSCHLEVDGGVDLNTCGTCKENGADVLVAGSAYFKATDKATFVKEIEA